MCDDAVMEDPWFLRHVLDHLKTKEMCNEIRSVNPAVFFLIPDRFKAQEACIKTVEVDSWPLLFVPNKCKTSV